METFKHLVRFVATDGHTYFGDLIQPPTTITCLQNAHARIIDGDVFGKHILSDHTIAIHKILMPLPWTSIQSVRCIGLNYKKHAIEAKMAIPEIPVVFHKPSTSLSDPLAPISIAKIAQKGIPKLDYEAEMVIVIGKEGRNISIDEAMEHVLGISVGNDFSHRDWQLSWGGGQWTYGKGFDGWAPWGPTILNLGQSDLDISKLKLTTKVNGEERQNEKLDDMIFSIAEIVSFLSQGTTLQAGDLIFTGTPSGVQLGAADPVWLKNGDVVEVSLDGVGYIKNEVKFEEE